MKSPADLTVAEVRALAQDRSHRKKTVSKPRSDLVIVEIPLSDGWMSMFAGRLVSRDEKEIVLTAAAWIAHTGRRHLFFAGAPDSDCEIEIYPDGVEIRLPVQRAILTTWPHAPLRSVR